MKTKISIVLMTIIVALITCASKPYTDLDLYSSIKFTHVAKGNLYGAGAENIDREHLIISDSESWNELIDKMNTMNNTSESFREISIDFASFMIVAVFDDVKSTGGHSIDIIKIEEDGRGIVLTVDNMLTGNGTCIMTQPFQIVKIPKTDKLVIFE